MVTDTAKYLGSRYFKKFIRALRKDYPQDKLRDFDDHSYVCIDDYKLGLRLIHAGIASEDPIHYRHRLCIVVNDTGKASLSVPANTVVAHVLATNYTSRNALCDALLHSVQNHGRRVLAGPKVASNYKCQDCGHQTMAVEHYRGHIFSSDEHWTDWCCTWKREHQCFLCCCGDSYMTPSNSEKVDKMEVPPGWWFVEDTPKEIEQAQVGCGKPKRLTYR